MDFLVIFADGFGTSFWAVIFADGSGTRSSP